MDEKKLHKVLERVAAEMDLALGLWDRGPAKREEVLRWLLSIEEVRKTLMTVMPPPAPRRRRRPTAVP